MRFRLPRLRILSSETVVIKLKSPREIGLMREAGRVVARALHRVRELAAPGVTTAELDEAVSEIFREVGAIPLFRGVPSTVKGKPPFPAVICASVNEQIVHGIPNRRPLREGDILSIDTGCKLNGWCGDSAVTLPIGEVKPEIQKLLTVTQETLDLAIRAMERCRYWSEVASLMEQYVKSQGMYVIEKFVGHGIGQDMHEEPQVPNFCQQSLEETRHPAGAGDRAGHRADGRHRHEGCPYPERRLDRRDQGRPPERPLRAHRRHDPRWPPNPDPSRGLIPRVSFLSPLSDKSLRKKQKPL